MRTMSIVIMERTFETPPTDEELAKMMAATNTCLEINGSTRLHTYASGNRERFICVFEGPDAEAVRRAVESANVAYEKLWAATVF